MMRKYTCEIPSCLYIGLEKESRNDSNVGLSTSGYSKPINYSRQETLSIECCRTVLVEIQY
jgi:hypothetical protein